LNYKVIRFKCGCKYVWLNGTERVHKVCPQHKRPAGSYITWCAICDKKIIDKPQAGYRRVYCSDCYRLRQNERAMEWCHRNPGYWKKRDIKLTLRKQADVKKPETQKGEAARQIEACFQEMRMKFMPPVLEMK